MFLYKFALASLLVVTSGYVNAHEESVLARTESGWVRGLRKTAANGAPYASFQGVPYAKQPLGKLRFKELQPAKPWRHILNSTIEGPVCYQHNVLYGNLMAPRGVSESCIHANIYVPLEALPNPQDKAPTTGGVPIIVFYHGGGWFCGSGDTDVYGAEYIVGKGVIFITFNYRLDVLGFLSLGTSEIPGNNGLRDGLTLLRWVQRNARRFGGDPNQVTLAGQSAGSNNAHLLSLSPLSKGLFNRLWLSSGNAHLGFYTTSPMYAQQIATTFLTNLGLNGTDYHKVHEKLIKMPIEEIHEASAKLLPAGLVTFTPVQESPLPGVAAIVTEDPMTLIANGKGKDTPAVVGFTNNECEFVVNRLKDLDVLGMYKNNPLVGLAPHLLYTYPENVTQVMAAKVKERYFSGEPTMEEYLTLCRHTFFAYPALRLVRSRKEQGGGPTFMYKYSYEAEQSVFRWGMNLTYSGACHAEDITNMFKVNTVPVPESVSDIKMKQWMSNMFTNYVRTGSPTMDNSWPSETSDQPLRYLEMVKPRQHQYTELSNEDQDIIKFFDELLSLS